MKKLILFLLTATLLILPLSGCFVDNQQNEGTTPANTTENTTPESTTPEATTPEATTPPENDQSNPPAVVEELDKNHPLVVALLEYIEDLYVERNFYQYPFSTQINLINTGVQTLHVAFNPLDYYFVCGYANCVHESNASRVCCVEENIWIKYNSESEIQEYYNDMKCKVVFQINKALTVSDIFSLEVIVPDMEHFQFYEPTFENGVNMSAPLNFDETFIYLNRSNESTLYYSTTVYNHVNLTIPCTYLDGQHYISLYLYEIDSNGTIAPSGGLASSYILWYFGDYYDAIMAVMDTERYNAVNKYGKTVVYGIISFEDFVNGIIK